MSMIPYLQWCQSQSLISPYDETCKHVLKAFPTSINVPHCSCIFFSGGGGGVLISKSTIYVCEFDLDTSRRGATRRSRNVGCLEKKVLGLSKNIQIFSKRCPGYPKKGL